MRKILVLLLVCGMLAGCGPWAALNGSTDPLVKATKDLFR